MIQRRLRRGGHRIGGYAVRRRNPIGAVGTLRTCGHAAADLRRARSGMHVPARSDKPRGVATEQSVARRRLPGRARIPFPPATGDRGNMAS